MRLLYVRLTTQRIMSLALGVAAIAAVLLAAPLLSPAQAPPPARMTLMGTLSEWKYPGSNMAGGANMSDGGNPLVPDVKCRAILTTPDPIEKVLKFYSEMAGSSPTPVRPDAKAEVKEADAKAVYTQDDSEGRPVTLRVIVVSKADTTTTLVISRADGEKEIHIAWSHYRRFDVADK
jgi:hypothetical protein